MAVCNIFNNLTKETGTFFTFSQYMDDLTASQAQGNSYKVVPSKFVAMDLNNMPNGIDNVTFSTILREQFENGCAIGKKYNQWNPSISTNLFWDMMFNRFFWQNKGGLDQNLQAFISQIKYVGDINLQSYSMDEGIGYSEIYCHIPNDACSYKYSCKTSLTSNWGKTVEEGSILEGYQEGELNGREKLSQDTTYGFERIYDFDWDVNTKLPDNQFNINIIVILYDIYDSNHTKLYKNIPMGLYITGLISKKEIQNSITKYVSNEDIYNTGTSYGLRICSRYVATANNDNYTVKEVTIEDNNYAELSRIISQFSISQAKMDEVINKTYNSDQNYKELLSIFKNNTINVPYIKTVNGEDYWFVNGKMLTKLNNNVCPDQPSSPDTPIEPGVDSNGFNISAYIMNPLNRTKLDKFDLKLNWKSFYNGQPVKIDDIEYLEYVLYVNGVANIYSDNSNKNKSLITNNIIEIKIDDNDLLKRIYNELNTPSNNITCVLSATYKDGTISTKIMPISYWPTYFGEIDENMLNDVLNLGTKVIEKSDIYKFYKIKNTNNNTRNKFLTDIFNLNQYLLPTHEQTHMFSSSEDNKCVCLAYPTYTLGTSEVAANYAIDYKYKYLNTYKELETITDNYNYQYYDKSNRDDSDFNIFALQENFAINNTDYPPYQIYIAKESATVYNQTLIFK